jgi:hypothetical protein
MGLTGTGVRDPNIRLRFFFIILAGIIAGGSILYWRSQLLWNQEYVEFPQDYPRVRKAHLPKKVSKSIQTNQIEQELNNE